MSASDVVVVVLAVVVAILSGAVVSVLVSLLRALRELRRSVDALRAVIGDVHAAVIIGRRWPTR